LMIVFNGSPEIGSAALSSRGVGMGTPIYVVCF